MHKCLFGYVNRFAVSRSHKYNHFLSFRAIARICLTVGRPQKCAPTLSIPIIMLSLNGHRPVIGVPMMRSLNEFSAPIYGMRRTYLRALHMAGAAPFTIPLEMDEDTYRAMYERLDGVFLAGGEDIDPSNYGQSPHALLGQTDAERDRVELLFARLGGGWRQTDSGRLPWPPGAQRGTGWNHVPGCKNDATRFRPARLPG